MNASRHQVRPNGAEACTACEGDIRPSHSDGILEWVLGIITNLISSTGGTEMLYAISIQYVIVRHASKLLCVAVGNRSDLKMIVGFASLM